MSQTISITKQWQIHIPKKVREIMGLKYPGRAKIEAKQGKIIIQPVENPFLKHKGRFKHLAKKKKIDLARIRDYIDYSNL